MTDPKKLAAIKQVLSLPEHTGAHSRGVCLKSGSLGPYLTGGGLSFIVCSPLFLMLLLAPAVYVC